MSPTVAYLSLPPGVAEEGEAGLEVAAEPEPEPELELEPEPTDPEPELGGGDVPKLPLLVLA